MPVLSSKAKPRRQGLGLVRLILVWSSLSPVFILWAIRGVDQIPDRYWVPICFALFLLPTLVLALILKRARASDNSQTVKVTGAKDQREHLLTYLFAMLIPLFDVNLGGVRDIAAVAAAFIFVLFLFWHMRLHYMNLFFAASGYRIYTVEVVGTKSGKDGTKNTYKTFAILSKRHQIESGEMLEGTRLGGDVLIDKDEDD